MTTSDDIRALTTEEARALRPGDKHYTAYVGPPAQYDFMGATQFRLLTTLGLRAHHRVLDFGCGSLRAGRLLIPYLERGRYFGIEPNAWLVEDAIEREIGGDMVRLKAPRFDANAEFRTDMFDIAFDFIVAQSIFSHASAGLASLALHNFRQSLASGGLVACTFVETTRSEQAQHADGWSYPDCVRFTREEVERLFTGAGLCVLRIDWFHPRQAWYLGAHTPADLPRAEDIRHLTGAVLRDREFAASLRQP
jgi:SAM-dependent methyltransferase